MEGELFEQPLPGVYLRSLARHEDDRGWLVEAFRADELPDGFGPVMGYLSMTLPGVARGPHEHREQTDGFAFLSGSFRLYLWENRAGMPPAEVRLDVGGSNPVFVTVPPGVVHAYKNVGEREAFVLNFPDRLYGGWGRGAPVDEVRHEDDRASRFAL